MTSHSSLFLCAGAPADRYPLKEVRNEDLHSRQFRYRVQSRFAISIEPIRGVCRRALSACSDRKRVDNDQIRSDKTNHTGSGLARLPLRPSARRDIQTARKSLFRHAAASD